MNILDRNKGKEVAQKISDLATGGLQAIPAREMPVLTGIRARLADLRAQRESIDNEVASLEFEAKRFEADPSLEETILRLKPIIDMLRAHGPKRE